MSLKVAVGFAAALALGLVLGVQMKTPRTDRNWEPGLSKMPLFEPMENGSWRLLNLRAFDIFGAGGPERAWRDSVLDPADLEEVWFFIEPFPAFKGAAHTLVSFTFGGQTNQTVSISVEARREKGEVYSGVNGLFNKFELIYLWSTEKDVLTRIAVGLDHELYAYKLNISHEQGQAILAHFIERTNALNEQPRFYNTITSNCTNELVKSINDAFPGALPWHHSHVLTGYSARRLHDLGFLGDGTMQFETVRVPALASPAISAATEVNDHAFSASWRELMASEKS